MESTDEFIAFNAVDMNALAEQLNDFIEDGGTITNIYVTSDKIVSALVYGSKPDEDDEG